MTRPLVISDCDEVLLYMMAPFRDWLGEQQGIDFDMGAGDFTLAMTHRESGEIVARDDMWRLLNLFFDNEMHRQSPVSGMIDAMAALREHARRAGRHAVRVRAAPPR